jgi:hypothetical protein
MDAYLSLTVARFQSGPFAPRPLPRFFATMNLSDSQPVHWQVIYSLPSFGPVSLPNRWVSQFPLPILPCALPPFTPRGLTTALSASSSSVAGFNLSGSLATSALCNEAVSGLLSLRLACSPSNASPYKSPRTAHGQLPVERYYKVNSFQFTGWTRFILAHRIPQRCLATLGRQPKEKKHTWRCSFQYSDND